MGARQTVPEQWLIIDQQPLEELWRAIRFLPHRSGLLLLRQLSPQEHGRLHCLARLRNLKLVTEHALRAVRVHNVREMRDALLRRTTLIMLSPIHPTRSHPDWRPLPRMRAATLARLADRRLIALGGMDAQRYAKIAPLGFIGWAGISAFRI